MNLYLSMENDILMVSWEEPIQPNDFSWNYTLTITDNITGSVHTRKVLSRNLTQLDLSSEKLGMFYQLEKSLYSCIFSENGVPYIVSVFVTNGRGRGDNVSQLFYSMEDGGYRHLHMQLCYHWLFQSPELQGMLLL